MNQSQIKIFSGVSVFIGALVWFILYTINKIDVNSLESLKYLNLGITITGIFWLLYFKWVWKWSVLGRLLYKPNVNGTWLGEFKSDWKDQSGKMNPPKKFVLVVRQTWFSISIRAYTELQKTESYVETLMFDDTRGIKLIAYLFSEKRIGSGEHGARQGAAELDLIEDEKENMLEGHFWTQAGTRGYIRVNHASHNIYVDSFQQANTRWKEIDEWASFKE